MSVAITLIAVPAYGQGSPPATQEQGQGRTDKMDVPKLFATTCGWCHEGGGRKQGRGPKLAGTDKSDAFMVTRIKQGKSPGMPAFGKSFNDEQIQAIIAYIRALPP